MTKKTLWTKIFHIRKTRGERWGKIFIPAEKKPLVMGKTFRHRGQTGKKAEPPAGKIRSAALLSQIESDYVIHFLVPRRPRAAALRRFIRVFLMSATLRARTSSEFFRMVSQ